MKPTGLLDRRMLDAAMHYGANYLGRERWMSYIYQVEAVRDLAPRSAAEVGKGAGVLPAMLAASYPGCATVTIDIDPRLSPDICADVVALPVAAGSFDVAFCCQVLEHIPFETVPDALGELARIARRRVVVSVPDVRPFFFARARGSRRLLPRLWNGVSFPPPVPRTLRFDEHGQHHWEIGRRGYPLRRIESAIRASGLSLRHQFRMTERSYWHFFVLEPR